jgi:Flp pilus assembly protein TadG
MRRYLPARWRGERGQSLLETALMIPLVLMAVFWVFEVGWVMYTYSVFTDAANEGVRHAIVHSGGDAAGAQTSVKNVAGTSLVNISGMSTAVTFPDGSAAPPNRVRVAVTYSYVPVLGSFSPTMHTYAEGRMVVQ